MLLHPLVKISTTIPLVMMVKAIMSHREAIAVEVIKVVALLEGEGAAVIMRQLAVVITRLMRI
jgi:hypothetical protein